MIVSCSLKFDQRVHIHYRTSAIKHNDLSIFPNPEPTSVPKPPGKRWHSPHFLGQALTGDEQRGERGSCWPAQHTYRSATGFTGVIIPSELTQSSWQHLSRLIRLRKSLKHPLAFSQGMAGCIQQLVNMRLETQHVFPVGN